MRNAPSNIRVPAGDDLLRVPFSLNVRDLDEQATRKILETIIESLGAKYFRDESLFMEVLSDKRAAALKPFTFLYGPYVSVSIKQNGDLRVSATDEVAPGSTVYSHLQFFEMSSAIGPLDVAQAFKRAERLNDPLLGPSP